jgi:hypothetical protein
MSSIPVTSDVVRLVFDDRIREAETARRARRARHSVPPVGEASDNRPMSAWSSLLVAIRTRAA